MSKMEVISQCYIHEACTVINALAPVLLSAFVAFSISFAICVLLINPKIRHKRPLLFMLPTFMLSLVAILTTNWWAY